MKYLSELDKICKLPVKASVLSRVNYKSHLDCHNYYEGTKTNKQDAINTRNYFFSFTITEKECIIYQTESMNCEEEWIKKEAKTTQTAIKQAVTEFYKRYNK